MKQNRIWQILRTVCFFDISSESTYSVELKKNKKQRISVIFLKYFAFTLEESKIWMADSSSKIFPSDEESVSRILSSISLSCFLFAALCTISACLSSSRSGLKTLPNSYKACIILAGGDYGRLTTWWSSMGLFFLFDHFKA